MHSERDVESDYTALFGASPVATWIVDRASLQILVANAAAASMQGVAAAELVGTSALAIHPETSKRAILEDGERVDCTHARRGGGAIDVEVSSRGVRFRGRDARLVVIGDLAARTAAEVALRESEERYRGVVEEAFDAILIHQDGLVKWANRAFAELSGYPLAEVIGRPLMNFVAPDKQALVREQTARSFAGRYRAAAYSRAGERLELEVCLNNCMFDGRAARFTAIRDVTAQTRAEEARQGSEARFRELIERMPDMAALHRGGVIIYANPSYVRFLGWDSAADLVGKQVAEFIDPSEHALFRSRMEDIRRAGATGPLAIYTSIGRDGSRGVFEVASVPFVLEGEPTILTIGRDVTARKELERRLVQADLMASVGTLAAGIAHEINNPISYAAIHIGLVELRLTEIAAAAAKSGDGTVSALAVDALRSIFDAREGTERVVSLVRDFKTFSRAESQASLPIDVRVVLDSAIKMAWNEIRHRARLVKEYRDAPLAAADEARLGQVFLNLITNALQALPDRNPSENRIRLRVGAAGGRVVVEVEDNGDGMAPESLARIFEPFFTTKPNGVGTGLGLSICKGIVDSLGGEISITSELGRGTTCRVVLPAALPAALDAEPSAPRRPSKQPVTPSVSAPMTSARRRLLIVDDEALLVKALTQELGRDHDTTGATSVGAALELCDANDFAVVLCDLMMPNRSGIDFYREVARLRPGLERRIVFMTGGAFTESARAFLDSIANERVEKPFDLDRLRAILRDMPDAQAPVP